MKKIVILSGKGGVGKSSVTASLAVILSEKHNIICADCDVDASNLQLVLGVKEDDFLKYSGISTNKKVRFDETACTSCMKCVESCYFDAIGQKDNKPYLKEFSCEGCGLCEKICPSDAISLVEIENAVLGDARTTYGFSVVSAQLKPGESGSGKVVAEVKNRAFKIGKDADYMLIDSAAGIGCPVIASVTGSDFAILVTEPTPSGIDDMKKAKKIVEHFRIPYGIVINKHDVNPRLCEDIKMIARESGVKILGKIPYDQRFMEALVNLTPVVEYEKSFHLLFEELAENIIGITG